MEAGWRPLTEQRTIFDSPLQRARELKARRRYDAAREVLQAALRENPDDLKLKASLADLHYRLGQPRRALALAGQILRQDPNDPRALVVMGNALLARGKPGEALEYFKLALAVAPTDYLFGRIARCQLELGQPPAALESLNRAEAFGPPSPRLLALRARAYRLLGEGEAERQELLRAARQAPADAAGFFQAVWPLLEELAPRPAATVSAQLRDSPGQQANAHLLLFEAEALLRSRDRRGAAERLAALRAAGPPAAVRPAVDRLAARLEPTAADGPRDGHER